MLIESWVLCYLIYVFLILICLLCIRIRQNYNLYPVIDASYVKPYLITFNDLSLPFFSSESHLLKTWQSFYLLKDVYKIQAFKLALRWKFDLLIEETVWFLYYYNEKPILDQILAVVEVMPNIAVDIESTCQMLNRYSSNPAAQKIVSILSNSNQDILTYEQNQNIELLFYFAFIACLVLFTGLLKIYGLGFRLSMLEQYGLFGRAVPIIYLLTILAPVLPQDRLIGRIYYYLALFFSTLKLALSFLFLAITIYKYTRFFDSYIQGCIFYVWIFLLPLLFQYWILSYLILFYNRVYMISKISHFGFVSFLFCICTALNQFISLML